MQRLSSTNTLPSLCLQADSPHKHAPEEHWSVSLKNRNPLSFTSHLATWPCFALIAISNKVIRWMRVRLFMPDPFISSAVISGRLPDA